MIIKKYKVSNIWDKEISDSSLSNIDTEIIKNFVDKAYNAGRISFSKGTVENVIKKLHLLKDNKIINAGKVLFCKNADVCFQLAVFAGNEKLTFLDIDRVKGNIYDLLLITETYIIKHIDWRVQFGKMERIEIPEIPITALREALVNSLCHRDYTVPENNKIAIFKNRIEIYNPGNFPDLLKPDDYIKDEEESVLRNPIIAEILYKSKDIEMWGTGLKRIFNECKDNNIKV